MTPLRESTPRGGGVCKHSISDLLPQPEARSTKPLFILQIQGKIIAASYLKMLRKPPHVHLCLWAWLPPEAGCSQAVRLVGKEGHLRGVVYSIPAGVHGRAPLLRAFLSEGTPPRATAFKHLHTCSRWPHPASSHPTP